MVTSYRGGPRTRLRAVGLAIASWGMPLAALAQVPAAPAAVAETAAAEPAAENREVDVFEYIVRGNTALDLVAIEQAVTPFLGPRKTLKDIEAARDALTAVYQSRGFQSVHVDLPEQQVTEGVVVLQVNETRVGRVRVVGSEYTSPADVRTQVPALQEGTVPNFTQAQVELTALNRTGRRQVMPLVKQGSAPGTMDVDLKVDDNNPWRFSAGANNDNSADTKRLRATATIGHDNLWQLGHSLSLSFFGTPQDLDQTKVWSGSYVAPLRGSDWSLEASGYKSDSNVATTGGTAVLGQGHAVGLKATYTVPNSEAWWHSFSFGVDFKNNQERLMLGSTGDRVPLKYAPLSMAYSGYYQGEKLQYGLGMSLVYGTRSFFGYGSDWAAFDYKRYKASPSFLVAKADVNGALSMDSGAQIGFRLSGQITDSPLVSGEQIAAGGMNSVRGYLSAEAIGDVGLVGSLEWRTRQLELPVPQVQNLRLYAFADAGHLRLRSPLPEQQDRFTLSSLGVGTSFKLGTKVTGRVDIGYPLRAGVRTEKHDTRITFNLNASY